MKNISFSKLTMVLHTCKVIFLISLFSLSLFSFTVNELNTDFLKELGIGKTEADKKISNSILGGYINSYGITNAKNIALGNRGAVVKDLLNYTRQYVNSTAFKTEYLLLKESNKPKLNHIQTHDEMRKAII